MCNRTGIGDDSDDSHDLGVTWKFQRASAASCQTCRNVQEARGVVTGLAHDLKLMILMISKYVL